MTRRRLLILFGKMFRVLGWAAMFGPAAMFVLHQRSRQRVVMFSKSEQLGCAFKEGVYLVGKGKKAMALSGCCSHLGCTVSYDPAEQRFVCPCHQSEFDGKGTRLKGPAVAGLKRIDTRVADDGSVEVVVTG